MLLIPRWSRASPSLSLLVCSYYHETRAGLPYPAPPAFFALFSLFCLTYFSASAGFIARSLAFLRGNLQPRGSRSIFFFFRFIGPTPSFCSFRCLVLFPLFSFFLASNPPFSTIPLLKKKKLNHKSSLKFNRPLIRNAAHSGAIIISACT